MKIIDCVIFNDEKLLLDLRFNILNNIVDFFVVCESSYDFHGRKKKVNFSIGDYPNFKNQIIYYILHRMMILLFIQMLMKYQILKK